MATHTYCFFVSANFVHHQRKFGYRDHRVLKGIAIPKANIVEKKQIPSEDTTWTIRTFGVGGLFGYYGKFFHTKYGSMIWYATQRKNYVMLVTQGTKFVLTPNEPEKFLAALS